jgi:hypothetical protein
MEVGLAEVVSFLTAGVEQERSFLLKVEVVVEVATKIMLLAQ